MRAHGQMRDTSNLSPDTMEKTLQYSRKISVIGSRRRNVTYAPACGTLLPNFPCNTVQEKRIRVQATLFFSSRRCLTFFLWRTNRIKAGSAAHFTYNSGNKFELPSVHFERAESGIRVEPLSWLNTPPPPPPLSPPPNEGKTRARENCRQ